jgi:hypothetical protein
LPSSQPVNTAQKHPVADLPGLDPLPPFIHPQAAFAGLGDEKSESDGRPDSVPSVSWHRPASALALAPLQRRFPSVLLILVDCDVLGRLPF